MPRRKPGTLVPLEFEILEVGVGLQSSQDTFYGFALARGLAAHDGSALTAHGTLYKALGRMTQAGLLEAVWEDAEIAETEHRPRRRLYRVTAEGKRVRTALASAAVPGVSGRPAGEGARFA